MNILSILSETSLFNGLEISQIDEVLSLLSYNIKNYNQQEIIVHQGNILTNLGIVLQGNAQGVKLGVDGEVILVSTFTSAHIFGDVLSGAMGFNSPVTIKAVTNCEILFIPYKDIINSSHPIMHKVLQNMIKNISLKYFYQNQRLDILMLKTLRQKITYYLTLEKNKFNNNTFNIPLNRQMLADYLATDRTALSRELSVMKKQGLIDYHKNSFKLFF